LEGKNFKKSLKCGIFCLGFKYSFFILNWIKTPINMKNLRIIPPFVILLTLVLLLPTQFGCDLIDKIKGLETFEVDFDQCIDRTVDIAQDDPDNIHETFTISAEDNYDLVEYLSNIEGWDVIVAYLQVSWINGDPETTFSGTVTLGNYTQTFTDIKPYEWSDGRLVYLNLDNAALTALNEDLNNDNKIVGTISGKVSHQPVRFVVYLCIEAVVEVKA